MSSRKPAAPARDALLRALRHAGREHSNAAVLYHSAVAERMGLSPTDEKALGVLERHGPLTAGELAERLGLANTTVTSVVDRLQRKRFVRRAADERDRRRVIVEANPERVAEFAPLFEPFGRSLEELYETYSDEQLATVLDFLTRSAERQRDATKRLAGEPP